MKKLVFLVTFLVALSGVAQNEALFEQGKKLYKAEQYQEALDTWMKILKNEKHSDALYFNIANAHYKLNNVGPSVYYYEKAQQLNPNDFDIKNNLTFAENARIDAIEPLPETIFKRWYKSISGIFIYDGWAVAVTIMAVLFVILFLLYYFSFSEKRKRILFAGASVAIFLLLFSLVMSFKTYDDFKRSRQAIIFAEIIEVKSEPTLASEVAFILHEGTKVQILEEDEQWYRIRLVDGKDGWLLASELKEL